MAAPQPVTAGRLAADITSNGLLQRLGRVVLLGVTDVAALFLCGSLAYLLWARPMRVQSPALYLELAPLLLLFVLGYSRAGLYPGFGLGPVETLRRISYVTAFGFLVLAAFSFALKLPHLYSRVTFGLAFAFSLIFVPVGRVVILKWVRGWRWWAEPVVVIGTGHRAARAIRSILEAAHLGYRPVAVLALDREAAGARMGKVATVPVIGGLDLADSLASRGIRVALLETDLSQDRVVVDRLQQQFRHVVLLREYDDLPVEGIQVRNLGSMVGIEYTNNLLLYGNQVVKRTLDLLIAGVALLMATPLIVVAAALVRLIDGGPVLFFHRRKGLGGRTVAVPKIRTMKLDAEKRLEEYLGANPGLREEWQTRFKLRKDPRLIPVVGKLFRRFSVDELPQLLSVVVGDMSLVGPRPLPDYHVSRFPPDFIELRQRVRPGITGLWQITVRSEGGLDEQQGFDTYYIRNWSVWLDLYVLSRTFAVVATGRGAY
jgi:Undecaprenyl-phosphate galactose phosphotransferase WbaP